MSYEWGNCPQELQRFVLDSVEGMVNIIEQQPVGVYLHGSLAMGGFNPNKSDIDLIVVTNLPLSSGQKRELVRFLLERSSKPFPIEISSLTLSQIENWSYPTPYDFHFSEFWRARYEKELSDVTTFYLNDDEKMDVDLAAHFTMMHHRGIVLSGQPIHDIFPRVPEEDFLASILEDYEECLENIYVKPVYCLLNLIRVYWYLEEGTLSSKKEAGTWGQRYLPEEYVQVVQKAARAYGQEQVDIVFTVPELSALKYYLKHRIEDRLRTKV